MNDNLLVSLQKYASRPSFNPIENFTTEAFAWLLRNDKNSEQAFIKLINKKTNKIHEASLYQDDSEYKSNFNWETQKSIKSGIADIVGASDNSVIVVEVKVGSFGNKNQLRNYVATLKETKTEVIGVLLTSSLSQHTMKDVDCPLLWEEVYICLKSIKSTDGKERRQEFIDFLEYKGLSPSHLPFDVWLYSKHVFTLIRNLKDCFNNLATNFNKIRKQDDILLRQFNQISSDKDRWGRIGISLLQKKPQ